MNKYSKFYFPGTATSCFNVIRNILFGTTAVNCGLNANFIVIMDKLIHSTSEKNAELFIKIYGREMNHSLIFIVIDFSHLISRLANWLKSDTFTSAVRGVQF